MTEAKVVGVTFRNEDYKFDRQEIISRMNGKEKIYLKREPGNKFDKNAVAVVVKFRHKDLKIGYVRAELAAFLSDMWTKYKFTARVMEIRAGDIELGAKYGVSIDIRKIDRAKLKKGRKK